MSLSVTSGPLPQNGSLVHTDADLENWVNGTTVYSLPGGAFKGGGLTFVVSSTDAPATAERTGGMLWFQRGTGLLFVWDVVGLLSNSTSTNGSVPLTQQDWIAIGGRKDIWVATIKSTVPQGVPLFSIQDNWTTGPTACTALTGELGTAGDMAFAEGDLGGVRVRPVPIVMAAIPENSTGGYAFMSEMMFVALDSCATNGYIRAVELGFCNFLAGTGTTGAGGFAGLTATNVTRALSFNLTAQTANTELAFDRLNMVWGVWTDSSATAPAGSYLRPAYKMSCPPIGSAALA